MGAGTRAAAPAPDQGAPAVVFDDVVVRFDGGEPVLAGVSFALAPGSFHFVTGASGSGKTTVLKLIAMAERPSSGRIRLFGRDVTAIGKAERAPLRRRLGVVFQEFGLQDHLTAFDNVALACRAAGRRWRDYRAEVAELLGWVGLGGRMAALPAALSAGERQRLALARAVINRPELLIADEPTGAVDNALALRLLRLFTDLNKVGVTVLIASHDEDLVARSGAPRLHLSDGRLTAFPAPTREVGA